MGFHNTLFSQTLSLIPRHIFQKLEHRHKTGRSSRRFGFKEQFTTMAFIQLAARRSMRDGILCLAAAGKRLYHWGLSNVARSTFADANNSRPVDFFKDLFGEMYALCAAKAPKHKFCFKSKLLSMDATTIKTDSRRSLTSPACFGFAFSRLMARTGHKTMQMLLWYSHI